MSWELRRLLRYLEAPLLSQRRHCHVLENNVALGATFTWGIVVRPPRRSIQISLLKSGEVCGNMQSLSFTAVAAQPADDEERFGDLGGEPAVDHHHRR
jgi:hypothetical protein